MAALGRTDVDVSSICLSGNVFGWTADTTSSYLVEHGRSEAIIGGGMVDRGTRDQLVIASKSAVAAGRYATCARTRSSARRTRRSTSTFERAAASVP
jgi:aryl-alcohol dehydrogenase-like predicted oxidoreductase